MNVVYRIGLSIIIFYALILNLHAYDEGFNGLDWGDPPKPGMNLLDSRGYFKFYSDDLDQVNKDLSDYGIEGITYGFCRNKFCEMFGRIKGKENFERIAIGITNERGQPNINKHIMIWFAQTDILMYFEEETDTGYFLHYNNPVHLELAKNNRIYTKAEKESRYLPKKEKKKK